MQGPPPFPPRLAVAAVLLFAVGCAGPPRRDRPAPDDPSLMRVRLTRTDSLRVRGPARIQVRADGADRVQTLRAPLRARTEGGAFVLESASGTRRLRVPAVRLTPGQGERIRLEEGAYRGRLRLHRREGAQLDVINDVSRQAYIAGVLAREMPTGWPKTAYRAQAIAARSWAAWRKRDRDDRAWDVRAGTAGQAYGGGKAPRSAMRAARATKGEVLLWAGSVLPAFYSSTCGGIGQDGRAVARGLAKYPPLRGRRHRPYCQASKWYRWGPLERGRRRLQRRLIAWGRAQGEAVRKLQRLEAIRVLDRNAAGRPAAFALRGRRERYRLRAVSFRAACNFQGEGSPSLAEDKRLRSSHVRADVGGATVRFRDGRGYGHGVGLCQWGARGMARRGFAAREILAYYYPKAGLARLGEKNN